MGSALVYVTSLAWQMWDSRVSMVVPLQTAVQGFDAWLTAIRRDQTPERTRAPIVGRDPRYRLTNWRKEQVWDYIQTHNVPVNPLHAQGYPSIGCWPCSRPIFAGEDDRAGRWAGTAKRECGLHL